MPTPFRRYELLLPTNFNDGRSVPDELIGQTVLEIRNNSALSQRSLSALRATGSTKVQ